jgi:hypothetical protein
MNIIHKNIKLRRTKHPLFTNSYFSLFILTFLLLGIFTTNILGIGGGGQTCPPCYSGENCSHYDCYCGDCIGGACGPSKCNAANCESCCITTCNDRCAANCQNCDGAGNCTSNRCSENEFCSGHPCWEDTQCCDKTTCQVSDGHGGCRPGCNPSGCDSYESQHCVSQGCQQCLHKAFTFQELMACTRIDDPSTEPQPNGCGPEPNDWISDDPAHCSDHSSFLGPCNTHDMCYQSCCAYGSCKGTCDSVFGDDMHAVCQSNTGLCNIDCEFQRIIYWTMVAIVGQSAYESAQINACVCCVSVTFFL